MKYMLDSTFIIDHLRAEPAAMARLGAMYRNGDDPIVTSIITTEAWSGRRSDQDLAIERFMRYFEYVHPGPSQARMAGEWRAAARAIGRALDTPDALIAATAYDLDATLLTRNVRDFELTSVRIETY